VDLKSLFPSIPKHKVKGVSEDSPKFKKYKRMRKPSSTSRNTSLGVGGGFNFKTQQVEHQVDHLLKGYQLKQVES
jgi:hypothetical protein